MAREPLPPRLIRGMQADYIPADWSGTNDSGLHPYGVNLLILMDQCAGASAGGIMLPDEIIERMNEASVTGCIFEIGEEAFRHQRTSPSIGQRVYIEKYAGIKAKGKDGRMYRLVDEKCVACGIDADLIEVEE